MLNFRDFLKEARSMSDAAKNDIEYLKLAITEDDCHSAM